MKVKIILPVALFLTLGCGSNAFADLEDIAGKAIDGAVEVLNSDKTSAKITRSKIKNKTTIDDSISIGNSGIQVTADEVEITDSELKNETKVTDGSVAVGNQGINIGDASQAGGLIK